MEKYNKHIAENPNVEFVHVSLDRDDDAAEGWAAKDEFPWLTILPDDVEKSGLRDYKKTKYVPEYVLLNGEGKIVVAGNSNGTAAFSKIDELAEADE